jgi:hyperosmotically inducible protein
VEINMSIKAVAVAAVIAVAGVSASGCASQTVARNTEAAEQYASDTAITTKVKTALIAEPNLKALDVNVETQNGVVQLAGFVESAEQIHKAVAVAKGVSGVREVKNDLRLKSSTGG